MATNKKAPVRKLAAKPRTNVNRSALIKNNKGGLFSSKKALFTIGLIAFAGVLIIWRSFAATPVAPYQYSVKACIKKSSNSATAVNNSGTVNQVCVDKSAESLTYRYFKAFFGRNPDVEGYKYWVQKLAGDRVWTSSVAKSFLDSPEGKATINQSSDSAFLDSIYQKVFGRAADSAGKTYWTKMLAEGKTSRWAIAAQFAKSQEAINRFKADFNLYRLSAPSVTVVQTAKTAQINRYKQAANEVAAAKWRFDIANGRFNGEAQNRINESNRIAGYAQANIGRNELDKIGQNGKWLQQFRTDIERDFGPNIRGNYTTTTKVADDAAKVAWYSPDISDNAVKGQVNMALFYVKGIDSVWAKTKDMIGANDRAYSSAVGKYRAEQARLAALAARNRGGGGGSNNDSGDNGGAGGNVSGGDPKCRYPSNILIREDVPEGNRIRHRRYVYRCNSQGQHTETSWGTTWYTTAPSYALPFPYSKWCPRDSGTCVSKFRVSNGVVTKIRRCVNGFWGTHECVDLSGEWRYPTVNLPPNISNWYY